MIKEATVIESVQDEITAAFWGMRFSVLKELYPKPPGTEKKYDVVQQRLSGDNVSRASPQLNVSFKSE